MHYLQGIQDLPPKSGEDPGVNAKNGMPISI